MSNNKLIAKNTLFVYFRMIIIMGVTLFTSRVILQSLGVEDFGIYNVVGGVAAMFNIILGSLTDATQRFITFEIGKKNGNINKVFSTSLLLHFIIALVIVLIAEPIGLWFLYNKLIIPVERLNAAFWVFQCSVLSIFFLIISIPYNALIVANERMKAFAFISIVDACLRLLIAFTLFINLGVDVLILYAVLMLSTQITLRVIYTLYCKKHFPESKFIYCLDRKLIGEIGKFSTWTLFGNTSFVLCTQGLSLLLGTFFNPAVNASRGIAIQVQGAIQTFIKNFQTAINPQITKKYANNEFESMFSLVFQSSKFSYFLVLVPSIPILFATKEILHFWLGVIPDYTIAFVQIMVISTMLTALINPLEVSAKATGAIKRFEAYVYGTKLLILPISYIAVKIYREPYSVFIVTLLFDFISLMFCVYESHHLLKYSIKSYFKVVIIPLVIVTLIALTVPVLLISSNIMILIISSIVWTLFTVFILGINRNERAFIINMIKKLKKNDY